MERHFFLLSFLLMAIIGFCSHPVDTRAQKWMSAYDNNSYKWDIERICIVAHVLGANGEYYPADTFRLSEWTPRKKKPIDESNIARVVHLSPTKTKIVPRVLPDTVWSITGPGMGGLGELRENAERLGQAEYREPDIKTMILEPENFFSPTAYLDYFGAWDGYLSTEWNRWNGSGGNENCNWSWWYRSGSDWYLDDGIGGIPSIEDFIYVGEFYYEYYNHSYVAPYGSYTTLGCAILYVSGQLQNGSSTTGPNTTPFGSYIYINRGDEDGYLYLTGGYTLPISTTGYQNWEYALWVLDEGHFILTNGTINIYNGNTSTGSGPTGTANIGLCMTVDGIAQISGGTINIDDDLIIHGRLEQSGGVIVTGYDSHDGGVWVSGNTSPGPYSNPTYSMTGGQLYVERYMFTSGYNADPWNYGLGSGRFQASGGTVYLTAGTASSGTVYVYDGGSTYSYFNTVYVNGTTYIDATYGNYMYIIGSMFFNGGRIYPIDRIRFIDFIGISEDIREARSFDKLSPNTNETEYGHEFFVKAYPSADGISFHIFAPYCSPADIEIYDYLGHRVASRETELGHGQNQILLDVRLPMGIYFYRVRMGFETKTGRVVKL